MGKPSVGWEDVHEQTGKAVIGKKKYANRS